MNSHSYEIRTYRDLQAQADPERMLAARRVAEAAREAKFRKLPTPSQPEPVQMCAVVEDAPVAPWIVWTLRVALSLLLAFIAYGLGLAVRP